MAASQKTDFNKKDMNFFSEFTTSGTQLVSSFAIILLAFAVMLAYVLGSFLYYKIQINEKQKQIDSVVAYMNKPETIAELQKYSDTMRSVEDSRTYLYTLKQLDIRYGEYLHASTSMMDTINEVIPTDITITGLEYEDGQVVISGNAFTASAPLEMAQLLQDKKTFYYVSIDKIDTITVADIQGLTPEELATINRFYFTFTGALESTYSVTYSRIMDNAAQTPISTPTSATLAAGEEFLLMDINSFEMGDKEYTLTRMLINGKRPSNEDMERFIAANEYATRVTSKIDIQLYYAEKEGDAK
ncbi:MAG: PilN domain-containing protein [Clostridiaceae bacterium]|jgi:hypothetical protein|nr:PilN domain-containing protein [Oscillospiraceae bacterium]NLO62952.1 PilN domain-containing protein [Clostridiaceae bacterium]